MSPKVKQTNLWQIIISLIRFNVPSSSTSETLDFGVATLATNLLSYFLSLPLSVLVPPLFTVDLKLFATAVVVFCL